jgi:hypothetical protein
MILLYVINHATISFPYFIANSDTGDCTLPHSSIVGSVQSYNEGVFREVKLNELKIYSKLNYTTTACIDITSFLSTDLEKTEKLIYSTYPELLL